MNPKNIYAIMNDSAYSVQVRFLRDGKANSRPYDYVTTIPNIKVGDFVIVMAPDFDCAVPDTTDGKIPAVVQVVSVDEGVTFDPMDSKAYGWLVGMIDRSYYDSIQAAVMQEADKLRKAQRSKMREQFKQQFLNAITVDAKQ